MTKTYGRFEGTIGPTLAESEPWFGEHPHPGEDAPNVVVILLDDLGFSHFGCYGSTIASSMSHRSGTSSRQATSPKSSVSR